MTPLRILTVDDELLALKRLKLLLQTIPQAEQVGEATGCAEALAKINQLRPDVVLLDIKMRDGNGFEVVEALARRPNPPSVIFVTAFDQYAAQAFDSAVADYLLKPVERERLVRALIRVEQQLHAKDAEQRVDELQQILRNLRASRNGEDEPAFETEFWLRGSNGLVRVPVDAIDCVSSADEYVAIHTASGSHLMRGSIRQFVERVEPGLFVRVHRRWLVKRSAISELSTQRIGGTEVVLRNGKRLPAGRVHLKQLRQSIQAVTRH
jgi:two-component system LytT family response regulator